MAQGKVQYIKRTDAATVLNEIREMISAAPLSTMSVTIRAKLKLLGVEPLLPCQGEAHQTGPGAANGHVDHCSLCAPRWGWTGPEIKVR